MSAIHWAATRRRRSCRRCSPLAKCSTVPAATSSPLMSPASRPKPGYAAAILKDWGRPYDIVSPGLAIKQHPCCGSTHPAIDALLLLRAEHEVPPEKVTRIDSWTHPRRLAHTDRPEPGSGLDAKFSVQ